MDRRVIHILMGLPGSGKTFFAKSFDPGKVNHIELDQDGSNSLYMKLGWEPRYIKEVLIDGLILTVEDLKDVIDVCIMWEKRKTIEFNIYYWMENREACLKNDKIRVQEGIFGREINSNVTIKNATFDSLDKIIAFLISSYGDKYVFNIHKKEVYIPTPLDLTLQKYSPRYDKDGKPIITSKSWCTGGTWGDYRGNSGPVEPEDPEEFTGFDDLLTDLCPEITFLQYKKIFRECVTLENYQERDYYGGSTNNSYYKCEISKLMEVLKEMGVYEEKNDLQEK